MPTLELAILIALFVLLTVLAFKNFKFFVYVLLGLSVLLHKELFSFYLWDFMPVRMAMLAAGTFFGWKFTQWVLKNYNKDFWAKIKSKISDPFVLLFSLVTLSRYISLVNTANIKESLELTVFFTSVYVLAVGLYETLKFEAFLTERYLDFYIFLSFLLSIFGVVQIFLYYKFEYVIGAFWSIPNNLPRVGSLFWDVNHFGAFLALLLPLIGVSVLTATKWKSRFYYAFVFLINTGILLMTNSRSAWILGGVAFLIFVTGILVRKLGYRGLLYAILAIVLISVPLVIEYSNKASPFRAKIKNYFNYRIDSFDSHFLLLQGALEVFDTYPIIGGGYGNFFDQFKKTDISAEYFSRDPAGLTQRVPAHTIWGENLADTGILGSSLFALLYILVVGLLVGAAFSSKNKEYFLKNLVMAAALCGVAVAGIFYSYNTEFFWLVFVLFFVYGITHNDFHVDTAQAKISQALGFLFSSRILPALLVLLVASALIFTALGSTHLIVWDEAIYAKIARNIVDHNEALTLHWRDSNPWFEKPPLYMWLSAGLMSMFGFSSLTSRLPSAILGLLTVLGVYLFATKLYGKKVGFISALVLVTTSKFLYYSRASMLDVSVGFFVFAALSLYYLSTLQHKNIRKILYIAASGAMVGLAVMTKGVVGVIPLVAMIAYEVSLLVLGIKKFSLGFITYLIGIILVGSAVALPWHYYMFTSYGADFLNTYLGYHVIDRALNSIEDKGKPVFWYLEVLKVSMRVWFIALLAALPLSGALALFRRKTSHIFLVISALTIFVVFSSATSKLVWYITPVYPFLSIIVGYGLVKFFNLLIAFIPKLNNNYFKFLYYFVLVVGGLFYLYFNRELVYTGDLTGNKAMALEYASKNFENNDYFIDATIEQPLILLYLNKPFLSYEYRELKNLIEDKAPTQDFVFVTKESRFREINQTVPNVKMVYQKSEWVVGMRENLKTPVTQ